MSQIQALIDRIIRQLEWQENKMRIREEMKVRTMLRAQQRKERKQVHETESNNHIEALQKSLPFGNRKVTIIEIKG